MSTTADDTRPATVLTIDEAAAYVAISKATLYTWRTRRAGIGPRAIKVGGCLRYRRADLDAWLEEHVERFEEAPTVPEQRREDASPRSAGVSLSRSSGPR
jgi:excisionase family DNA binding protein